MDKKPYFKLSNWKKNNGFDQILNILSTKKTSLKLKIT